MHVPGFELRTASKRIAIHKEIGNSGAGSMKNWKASLEVRCNPNRSGFTAGRLSSIFAHSYTFAAQSCGEHRTSGHRRQICHVKESLVKFAVLHTAIARQVHD